MKKRRFAQLVLMITMLFCLTFGTVCAPVSYTHLDVYKRQIDAFAVFRAFLYNIVGNGFDIMDH